MSAQFWAPVTGAALTWVSSAAVIVAFLPAPLRPVDYFLAGAVGTLIAAAAVFAGFARVSGIGDMFYKRRHRETRRKPAGASGTLGI
jgi:hypothetical protein